MKQNFNLFKASSLLLFGLFVFLYIGSNTVAEFYVTFTNPAAGLHFHFKEDIGKIVIYDVVSGSPAEKAGFQNKDQILSVNASEIKSLNEFVSALWNLETGKRVEVTALRDGQETVISFEAEKDFNAKLLFLALFPGALFGYALCLIGTFVLLKKIQDFKAQLFFLMVMFWAMAMRDAFPQGYIIHNILPLWVQIPLITPAWPLAVGLFLHFHLLFPTENRIFLKYRKLIIGLIYSPLLLIIPHLYLMTNNIAWGPRLLQVGWGVWLSLNFLTGLLVLRYSWAHAPNPYIKKQTEIMLFGTTLSLGVPFVFYFLPNLVFKNSLPFTEILGLLIILWPVTLAYVIIKHRFMNINFIIKRGVAYALVSGFVVAAYFLFVVGVGKLALLLTGSTSQMVTILATLFIAALFNPVKNRIQNFVERRFYPSRFTYREAIRNFGHELVTVLDLDTLLETICTFLSQTMKIRPVAIYWLQGAEEFDLRKTAGVEHEIAPAFSTEDRVVQNLSKTKGLLDFTPFAEETTELSEDESLRWKKLDTEMVLPLLSQQKLVGLMTVGPKEDDEPYFKEDLDLLQSLNDRINISLDNTMLTEELREQDRLKKELEVARRIQLSSLPQEDPRVPGLDVSGISIPAMEVGGDYYDYLEFPDGRFGVVVGDVSGKGTSAALYMSQLKGILKTASKYQLSLKNLMAQVNVITFPTIEAQAFITLACGAFDMKKREFSLVRAGHLPIIHYSMKNKAFRELTPRGIGIGLENGKLFDAELEEICCPFKSGDFFLFYSDGIIEAQNSSGDEFEVSSLKELFESNGFNNALTLRERIIEHVREFSANTSQRDDMTLVVVKIT